VGAAGTTDREVAAAIAPFQPTDFPQDRVKVVPLEYHSDTQTFLQDIIEAARNSVRDESHHRVVLNISMGICPIVDDKTDEVISRCSELPPSAVTARLALGREWLRLLRGEDDWWSARTAADPESLESRLLITASAGNDSSDKAFLNAPWTSAALPAAELGFGPGGDPVEHALNTLVVESREVQQAMVDGALVYGPGCRSWFSTHDGNIAAFGESARPFGVLVASDGAGGTRDAFGTSFAAPQVASLAMYLWSIAPELKAPDVKSRIVGTSRADCSNQMPVIDAYRAALSIDGPITGSALDAPVRRGLLDIDGSEVFDRADLDIFISAFQTSNGALRYSRADLNGDARTGGDYKEIFDLNGDGALSVVSVPNHARDASIDERSGVTDAQVLCYYAFSWLTLNGSDLAALKSGLGAEPACDGTPDVPLLRYTSITYTALPFHDPVVDFNDQGHILVQNVNTVFAVNNSDQVIGCNNGWGFLDNASPSILLTGGSPDVGHDHGCFLDINNHGVIAGASASEGIL
jgi:subtilisin family serine protease